jgi:hypothetical protein
LKRAEECPEAMITEAMSAAACEGGQEGVGGDLNPGERQRRLLFHLCKIWQNIDLCLFWMMVILC